VQEGVARSVGEGFGVGDARTESGDGPCHTLV
jgi:hypothetical protein